MLRLRHIYRIFFLSLLIAFSALSAMAQSADRLSSDYFGVTSPPDRTGFSQHIEFYLDATWDRSLEDMLTTYAQNFKPIETPNPNFGYIDEKVWLRIRLHNKTSDIDKWKFYVRENFLQYYDVYLRREDGRIEHLEQHDRSTIFSDRKYSFPELVTQLQFGPDEKITLYISYWSGGSSHAQMSLESEDSFSELAYFRTSKNYISYGMMIILLVAAAMGLVILRLPVFLAYIGYVLVTLLYLLHSDGITFQFLWPQFPRFNSYFSIVIGIAFIIVTYNFARVFLQTKVFEPSVDKILRSLLFLSTVILLLMSFIDPQLTKQSVFGFILLAIVAGSLAGLNAARTRFKAVRFYLVAWLFGIGSAGLMNMRHTFGISIPQEFVFDSIRISIIVDAIMMGLGITDHYIQTVQARRKAAEQTLSETQKNLELSTRLYDLEQQYTLATDLVESRDESLKNTVHDIRQPLHALRLNVQALRNGTLSGGAADIDDTFTYLENLIARQLESSVSGDEAPQPTREQAKLSLSDVLGSIHDMFLPDAREKGLDFRYVKTSANASIEPLILMRIVTNLVSNAIKYTPSGKILLGVRRINGVIRIEVHDTGLGMDAKEFATAKTRDARLHKNDEVGHGFGLSIADSLAQENGYHISRLERSQSGTSLVLELPS